MRTIIKSVLVHSCELQPVVRPESSLQIGMKYVLLNEDPKEISVIPFDGTGQFWALREKQCNCNSVENQDFYRHEGPKDECRKYLALEEAEYLLTIGSIKAVWQLNLKKHRVQLYTEQVNEEEKLTDEKWHRTGRTLTVYHFWKRQQSRVPRVDLITAADIRRAYLEETGYSINYIEDIHDLLMQNRLELFAPEVTANLKRLYYADQGRTKIMQGQDRKELEQTADAIKVRGFKDDPTEGRLIFPFPADERTKGGHR